MLGISTIPLQFSKINIFFIHSYNTAYLRTELFTPTALKQKQEGSTKTHMRFFEKHPKKREKWQFQGSVQKYDSYT